MMSGDDAFYGDGSKLIASTLEINVHSTSSHSGFNIDDYYEISQTVEWIQSSTDVSRVALQFPDELLVDSVTVISKLQASLPDLSFFILADTSYGSCCVDAVAAQHYKADVLVHYGSSCLSPCSSLPILWVFGRAPLKVSDCCKCVADSGLTEGDKSSRRYVLMFDVSYNYIIDELFLLLRDSMPNLVRSHLRTCANQEKTSPTDEESAGRLEVNGRSWCVADSRLGIDDFDVVYVGEESRTLTNLMMVMNKSRFYSYNPYSNVCRQETLQVNKALMKRFYLIEKAKDANIIGIVVGTLAVSNYLLIHSRLKELVKKAGKKSYSIVVGKLNTAKLANFMEVDMFVLVACPENSLIDSTQFYKPVITPYELELACNTEREWDGGYVTDFRSLLPEGEKYQPLPETMEVQTDVSLISGGMRRIGMSDSESTDKQLSIRETNTSLVSATSAKTAGEYLSSRTWSGLEQDLGKTLVTKARQGQTGIAMGYEDADT